MSTNRPHPAGLLGCTTTNCPVAKKLQGDGRVGEALSLMPGAFMSTQSLFKWRHFLPEVIHRMRSTGIKVIHSLPRLGGDEMVERGIEEFIPPESVLKYAPESWTNGSSASSANRRTIWRWMRRM